jgi:quercetin dioxygenase-like cupin family protein
MSDTHIFIENFSEHATLPENGILSRTIQTDARSKTIQFCFAPGQELSSHTAACPAMLYFAQGEAELQLGAETVQARAGSFAYMPPRLEHSIKAQTEVVMLLILVTGQ